MAECYNCKRAIRGEIGILCVSGLDQYSWIVLEYNSFIRYTRMCDGCIQYIYKVDMVLG